MLAGIGVAVSPAQLDQFRAHFELLLRWNARVNLTAIRDPREILRRHFVESSFLTRVLDFGPGTLVDVGSGAGFPGLPLKVLSPQTGVVLVESSQKKAAFLKEAIRAMGLADIQVLASRVEQVEIEGNWVVMRAVKPEATLLAKLHRLLVPRGTLALLLGLRDAERISSGDPTWRLARIPGSERRVVLFHVKHAA